MKKGFLIFVCAIIVFSFAGCSPAESVATQTPESTVDYSKYAFTDMLWTRDAENDIEYIRFSSDGAFSYYCACGNPVNDSDLCEAYTYDSETGIVELECLEITETMITTIKIINYNDNELELDFAGDIRKFTKDNQK